MGDEYYAKISVNSFCTNNKYFAFQHGDARSKSNDLDIERDISGSLPSLVEKANEHTYELQRRR
jgi:hypothetical protein